MSGTQLQALRSVATLLLVLLPACAHGPETVPDDGSAVAPAIREGDSLAQVRRKIGHEARVQSVSPTEKVLSALYPACPDVPRGPGDLSRPPCGAARLLTVRLRDDRVISLEWGDAPAAPVSAEDAPTAPPAP